MITRPITNQGKSQYMWE